MLFFSVFAKWISGQQTALEEFLHIDISCDLFLDKPYKGISCFETDFKLDAKPKSKGRFYLNTGHIAAIMIFANGLQIDSSETSGNPKYQIPYSIIKEGENALVISLDDSAKTGVLLDF